MTGVQTCALPIFESKNKLVFSELNLDFPEFSINSSGKDLNIYNKLSNSRLIGPIEILTKGPIIFDDRLIIRGPTIISVKEDF